STPRNVWGTHRFPVRVSPGPHGRHWFGPRNGRFDWADAASTVSTRTRPASRARASIGWTPEGRDMSRCGQTSHTLHFAPLAALPVAVRPAFCVFIYCLIRRLDTIPKLPSPDCATRVGSPGVW